MKDDARFKLLDRAWAPIFEWYKTADPRCPCKQIVKPHLYDWECFRADWLAGAPDAAGLDDQTAALRDAVATINQFAGRNLVGEIPETAETCSAGDPNCRAIEPLPAGGVLGLEVDEMTSDDRDPAMGAAPDANALRDVLAPFATSAGQVAGDAAKPFVTAVAPVAAQAALPVAQQAGEAAGKSGGAVAGEAAGKAVGTAAEGLGGVVVAAGVVVTVVVAGLAWLVTRKKKRG